MTRKVRHLYPIFLVLLTSLPSPARADVQQSPPVSFIRDVAPILVGKCQACHGPKIAESNYRLDTFELLMQPGDFASPPITAGDLENSEIHRLITAEDAEERMPNNGDHLTDLEIHTITAWIHQGAKFDGRDPSATLREQIPRDIPYPAAPETYPSAIPITALSFSPDGKHLIVGGYHELTLWNPATGEPMSRIGNMPQCIYAVAFSPDNTLLAIAGGAPGVSGEVRLIAWDNGPKADAAPVVLATAEDVFFDVAFRPDGHELAASGADGSVRIFETAAGAQRLRIDNHADWASAVCFSPDGKLIATASRDKTAKVFSAEAGDLLATHSEHDAPVRAVAFTPDGKQVLTAGGNRIRIWNVEDAKLAAEIKDFENDVYALSTDADHILVASADGAVRHYKMSDRALVRSLSDHPNWVVSLAQHEPSHRLAAGCFDGTVTVWNLEDGSKVRQFMAAP